MAYLTDYATVRHSQAVPINTDLLVRRRKTQGLLQKDLAAAAGITKQSMSQIEKGRWQPSPPVLLRIAAALELEPDELLNGEVA